MFLSFKQRRNYIVKELNRIGLTTHMPQGAFYVFPSIRISGLKCEEFCEKLLDEENLALVPGNAFGDCGEGFVRISYAYSLKQLKEALRRIENYVRELDGKEASPAGEALKPLKAGAGSPDRRSGAGKVRG